MGMLELRGIDKIYRSRGKPAAHAVRALDMDVRKGEIVALFGSSGCGKTSTLRMIAGFEEVTCRIDYARWTAHRSSASGAAKGRDGIRGLFALSAAHGAGEHRLRAEIAAQLPPCRRRRAGSRQSHNCSRSRTSSSAIPRRDLRAGSSSARALARALVRKADLYLLDEPMGQLEPQLARGAARTHQEPVWRSVR